MSPNARNNRAKPQPSQRQEVGFKKVKNKNFDRKK
jgi:hypothetical protein